MLFDVESLYFQAVWDFGNDDVGHGFTLQYFEGKIEGHTQNNVNYGMIRCLRMIENTNFYIATNQQSVTKRYK